MIERVGVVGAGVMGSEIAQAAASAGVDVVLLDSDPAALERGLAHITRIGERRVSRGRMSAEEAESIVARVTPSAEDDALEGCDLAIEAVPEIIDVKREVFRRLDAALPPDALIASNTSGFSIAALGRDTGRPDRVLGLHFFNPASVMRLVEVVRGDDTGEEAMAAGERFATDLGKVPIRVRECPGFLVNRVLVRALAEAYREAEASGAERAAVDQAVVEQGPSPMGPFALGDMIGLDTLAHLRAHLGDAYGARFDDAGAAAREVAAGRLGSKSGAGFYDGEAPEAEADETARVVARLYYEGALDEARRCLEENVAEPGDVDLAMRHGCGWSQGLLEWADERPHDGANGH